jgi:glutathione S-transferase
VSAPFRPAQPRVTGLTLLRSVLVEFVADLFPKAGVFSSDPAQRAEARFFIDQADTKFTAAYGAHLIEGAHASDLLAAVEAFQALLPAGQPFALDRRRHRDRVVCSAPRGSVECA